jgi:hypothetical protein
MSPQTRRRAAVAALLLAALAAGVAMLRLRQRVQRALEPPVEDSRPLQFVAVLAPERRLEHWGNGDVEALAISSAGLLTAGGSGVWEGERPLPGLPTLRASALALWRGEPVVALAAGGLYRREGGRWHEARSGWGTLHVRALAETPAGELLVGAREGLFRAAWGGVRLERLDAHPVRGLALGAGFVLAGGERGLYRVEPGRSRALETPDVWVESVGLAGDDVMAVTAAGVARGRAAGPLLPMTGGGDLVSGVVHGGGVYGVDGRAPAVVRLDGSGRASEELLPAPPRRLLVAEDQLFADTPLGVCRRGASGWTLVRRRPPALPGSGHVGALAQLGSSLVAGLFDGGLALRVEGEHARTEWREVPGSSAWGVNALLPAGGALYVASLRGAARFDGRQLQALEGPGAAFALAATPAGVAIGYGQGLLLPGPRLLSAFHGLPGNQTLALASGPELYVGTPSGLGAVVGRRVRWRVGPGDGALPHPWVTALALSGQALYVGTYGGGVVRRTGTDAGKPGRFEPFVETEGLKVNTGCLVEADGRLYLGTDGAGLYRLSMDRARFERLSLDLPSPRITALAATRDGLYVGTDEGLARLPLSPPHEELTE